METPVDAPIKLNGLSLGGPGSGKGTQCANIVQHFSYTHLSAGDLLRAEIRSGSEVGDRNFLDRHMRKFSSSIGEGLPLRCRNLRPPLPCSHLRKSSQSEFHTVQLYYREEQRLSHHHLHKSSRTGVFRKQVKKLYPPPPSVLKVGPFLPLQKQIQEEKPQTTFQETLADLGFLHPWMEEDEVDCESSCQGHSAGASCRYRRRRHTGETRRDDEDFLSMIQSLISQGRIVPSEITVKILCKAMEESGNDKFIIDGFPRNEENRIIFENAKIKPAFVLFFDCPEEELERRIMNRNQGREDDNLETINKRFKVFVESTLPIVSYYESKGKLRKINAAKPSQEVFEEVKYVFASET
ncbi:hypothetical protein F2Q69_00062238 [Brassica cretica]|uniref:adenylate kinase n=1 Tax=Brassica cretica TaxID=69181 RepID=A0A8S9RJY5_BRACR|nr:hypothetical protein F2Q69_00062238 [Brassica cretica]